MTTKKKILLSILLIFVIFSWWKFSNKSSVKTIAVKNVEQKKRIVTKTISASGEVKSEEEANLSFPLSQKIISLKVNEGDTVRAGQLLAVVENQNIVQTAQSYKDARDIALRQKELFERNKDDNKNQLGGEEQYEIKLREYNEEISRASAVYNAQLSLLKNSYLYSPIEGTVIDVTKVEGELASPGETIIKVADLNKLYFELKIDQEDFGELRVGMPATIVLDAYPNKDMSASISQLPVFVDSTANNSFIAKSNFKDTSEIKPILGMTGDIRIQTLVTDHEVNSLYYDQIFSDDQNKNYVWVLDKDVLKKYPVEIGIEGDIYTELKQDIDKQIVTPISDDIEIKEGYKAKVIK